MTVCTPDAALLPCLNPHCQRPTRYSRGRGLCRACYHDLAIRAEHVRPFDKARHTERSGRRGIGQGGERVRLPEPTTVLPGPDKVFVLEERARLGQQLWHPLDTGAEVRDLPEHFLPPQEPRELWEHWAPSKRALQTGQAEPRSNPSAPINTSNKRLQNEQRRDVLRLYDSGRTVAQIAESEGVPAATIWDWLDAREQADEVRAAALTAPVKMPEPAPPEPAPPEPSRADRRRHARQELRNRVAELRQTYNVRAVAAIVGLSRNRVRKICRSIERQGRNGTH
jgi:hypothetical protein